VSMPRGDIRITIAEMEALAVELRTLSQAFDAVGDTQGGHLCTEPDLQLQRWAASYADSLRRITKQTEDVVRTAKEGSDLYEVDWRTRKDWLKVYERTGVDALTGDAVVGLLDVLEPLWHEGAPDDAVVRRIANRWQMQQPAPVLSRERWPKSSYLAADTLGAQLEKVTDAADVTDDVREWWGQEIRSCRCRLERRRKLVHPD